MANQDTEKASSRMSTIEAVQKPINFFALVVLVVEVILGITANLSEGTDRTYLVIGMIVLIFALIFIVAFLAFFRPEALSGRRPVAKARPQTIETELPPKVDILSKPSLLLAASQPPYSTFLENDVKTVEELFPKRRIKIYNSVSSAQLRDILTDNHYDIVHLTIYVDDKDGSLVFGEQDKMPSEAFASLIEKSGTSLVVLAVCDSLTLAAKIARTANMIAAIEYVQEKNIVEWERMFYKLLSQGQPLSRAYEFARATTNAEMVLLMKKDFVIKSDSA